MRKLYIRIRKKSGVEKLTNHVCRHTFATRLIEMGADPKSVADLLGHAKVDYALNIYTHIEQEKRKQAIFLLEKRKK